MQKEVERSEQELESVRGQVNIRELEKWKEEHANITFVAQQLPRT